LQRTCAEHKRVFFPMKNEQKGLLVICSGCFILQKKFDNKSISEEQDCRVAASNILKTPLSFVNVLYTEKKDFASVRVLLSIKKRFFFL
jgi:hypothetical protein